MRKIKDSGIEWIGEIPEHWKCIKSKYIFNLYSGETLSKEMLIDNGKYSVYGGGELIGYYNKYNVSKKSILIGRVGARCGCVTELHQHSWATDNALIIDANQASKYIFFALVSADLNRFNESNAQPLITATKILNNFMVFPPIEEQQKIADFLDEKCGYIDNIISGLEKQIDLLTDYKKSLITETVTKGLNPDVEMKDSGIAWIGNIPKHWMTDKVKFHLIRREPRNPGNKQVLSVYREYGVIPKDSRKDNHNVTSEDTSNYKYVVPDNLVINKMKAWQGSMGISDYEGIVSPAYFIYTFTNDLIVPKYLHYLFRSCYKDEFRRISGGIREGQWDLSPMEFANTFLLIPPKNEQISIIEYLESKISEIDSIISKKKQQIKNMEEYKKSLIYEYVTGKKEI